MVFDAAWVADRIGLTEALRQFASTTSHSDDERIFDVLDENFAALADRDEAEGRLVSAARAHLRAAEQFVGEGRRAEADMHLDKALAFYRSVGATRYVREAEGLLAAAS